MRYIFCVNCIRGTALQLRFQNHHYANTPLSLSFCPTDNKFITCSDDSVVKVWDFLTCTEERAMRGHGAEVRTEGNEGTQSKGKD